MAKSDKGKSNKLSKSDLNEAIECLREDLSGSNAAPDVVAAVASLRTDLRNETEFLSQLIVKNSDRLTDERRVEMSELREQVAHEVDGLSQKLTDLRLEPAAADNGNTEICQAIEGMHSDVGSRVSEIKRTVDGLRTKPKSRAPWTTLLAAAASLVIGAAGMSLFSGPKGDADKPDPTAAVQTALAKIDTQAGDLKSIADQLEKSKPDLRALATRTEIGQLSHQIDRVKQSFDAFVAAIPSNEVARPITDGGAAGGDAPPDDAADQKEDDAAGDDAADDGLEDVPPVPPGGDDAEEEPSEGESSGETQAGKPATDDPTPPETGTDEADKSTQTGLLVIKNRCQHEVEVVVNGLPVKIPPGKMASMSVEPVKVKTQIGKFANTVQYWDKWSTVDGQQQLTINIKSKGNSYGLSY